MHCTNCGKKCWGTNAHVHHIRYPARDLEDLITLCVICHSARHPRVILTFGDQKQKLLEELNTTADRLNMSLPGLAMRIVEKYLPQFDV